MFSVLLLVVAAVLFAVAALLPTGRFNLVAAGLVFFTVAVLIPQVEQLG